VSTDRLSECVDWENGLVDRRIFSDPEVYALEMERIFARAWNFVCHETQIPRTGDYFRNRIGSDEVIAVRNREGGISVLLNSCRHRGNAVCRAEQGNAKTFLCPYHGWSYALDGKLVGVPGLRDYYRNDLEKEKLGLGQAAHVDGYKGFVFATMDPDAVPLEEYLGGVGRVGLDIIAERGEMEVVDGVQKNVVGCNWKLAVDNLFDWYHPFVSHKSAFMSEFAPALSDADAVLAPMKQMVMLGEYGHAIGGPMITREEMAAARKPDAAVSPAVAARSRPGLQEIMGPAGVRSLGHPNIFPNLWITLGGTQMCLRLPRAPQETELWWFTFADRKLPAEGRRSLVGMATHVFGPAGLLEQDDGENWEQCTRGTVGTASRRYPLHFGMGIGHDEVVEDGGQARIETRVNEHGQRWTYRAWADWMTARDWRELKANHTPSPTGVI
jgi:nitrite reductase/ring-hydroxylating ferredoxin subunit